VQSTVVPIDERRERAQAAGSGRRLDLYAPIHKGIRAFVGATLAVAGRMDVDDAEERAATLAEVRSLLGFLRAHLHHENQFVHPALEARRPGAARQSVHEHVEHAWAIENLESLALAVERAEPAERPRAAFELYRALAAFAAENFLHMDVEETGNNAQLWAAYTDAELGQIHEALLAAIPPAEMALGLRWMLPALTPAERAAALTGMQHKLPAEAFSRVLSLIRPHLTDRDWTKLAAAIGPLSPTP